MAHILDMDSLDDFFVTYNWAFSSGNNHKTLDIIVYPEGFKYQVTQDHRVVLITKDNKKAIKKYNELP